MDQKPSRSQRRKAAREAAQALEPAQLTPAQMVRRRRNRRMIFLGIIAVALPLLEVAAYRFRSIMIIVDNQSDEIVTDVKVTYPGGTIEAKELKPGGQLTELTRPNFTFTKDEFSSYRTEVMVSTGMGRNRLITRTGTVDYSARETYTIQGEGPDKALVIKHSTHPGFPLGTIRDLLAKLGVG